MPLSRLSALVPSAVGNYLATTFSVHHHPTVVRYRGILAQAFYHHGRLCASNQATVMVLVILFVGMISYPALVTYYNLYILSPYRHHPTASTNSHLGGLGTEGPASLRRSDLESGNLDEFWSGIIEPTWSQDPAMFQKTLPNKPLHYLAPVIINATDTFVKYENGAGPGILSDAEVLVYAADVQRRLQSITVDLTEDMLMSRQTPSSSSSSSSSASDPMDVWETPLEDGPEEDVDDNEVETNEEREEEGAKHSQQLQDGSHSGDNGQSEQKPKSSHRRRRQRRKVSLRDICVLDPQSLHHPPADRGYTRIWPEKDQEQHRATAGAEDSLMAIPLPSPNVDTWKANRDNPERGRNIVHLSEDQSGTSFGNNHLLDTTTFTDQPTTTHPSASPSPIQSNPSEQAAPSSSAEQPQPRLFECLIQSPVAYWQNDVERIRADKDILGTISSRQNSTLPLSQSTLFGGRVLNQQTNQVQGATSVIMTFFLRGNAAEMYPEEYRRIYGKHVDDSHDGNEHNGNDKAWRKDLDVVKVWTALFNAVMRDLRHEREAAWLKAQPQQQQPISQDEASQKFHQQQQLQPGAVLPPKSPNPMSEPMQAHTYAPTPSVVMTKISQDVELGHGGFKRLISGDFAKPKTNISAEYWLLAMAYFVMFLYISLSVGRVDLVKSKYGLGIAAVATVFVSLVMSIGICSVFGVTLTLMPWEILPFMIIVVGVENINILVHAVVETSMDLPVKERVGRGLGAVGVSITMSLLAELCLLIVGAMTTIPAVQEFCTFAIAAVIMDYLLQMTFFITVISIDIRRLELTDLSATGHRHRGVSFKYPYGNRHHHHHHHLSHHSSLLQYGPYSAAARGSPPIESEAAASHHPFIKHSRSGSHASTDGDDDDKGHGKAANKNPKGRIFTSIVMVGVMAYLGYIYGTTNQTLENEEEKKTQVSYWHIASPDVSSAFWKLVDPDAKGGYLEICPPVVLTMATPSYSANGSECVVLPQGDDSDCETTEGSEDEEGVRRGDVPDGTTGLGRQQQQQQQQARRGGQKGGLDDKGKPKGKRKGKKGKNNKNDRMVNDGTLDPRRPFKLMKQVIIFAFCFAFWLLRVFVIPSMILAAAILVLLSYLLSPQRKLLVDLQWRFPFIVLPGDYQSKRQLMMEQLLAQEARELGLDGSASSFAPLPGTVETFKRGGHVTDIEQMDVNPAGLILSSSMDKKILLWHGGSGHSTDDVGTQAENRLPLARLLSTTGAIFAATPGSVAQPYSFPGMAMMAATGETMKRVVRCLKLDPLGRYAAAGYTDGGVHLWEIDKVIQDLPSTPISPRQQQQQGRAPGVVPNLKATLELHRHYQQTDMPSRSQESTNNAIRARVTTLQFWNDVEEEEDDDGEEDYFGSARYRSAVSPPPSSLFVGYRDGQVCEWCPESGKLRTSFQTKHRGGVAELALVRLTSKTRKDLGLSQDKTYLVTGGKDGSLQCWVRFGRPLVTHYHHNQQQHRQQNAPDDEDQESWQWSRIWTQPGDGSSSSSIVVLSVDKEVPMVATGTANGAIKVWDLEQGNLIWTLSRGAVSAMPTAPTATTTTAAAASALYMTGGAGVQSSPAELHHSRKQSLGSAFENHQPSHQAAVTRIIFKPLELEDGVTGEPAPRVWLIISSGMDEVVMVWMVEWEGLLSMKPAGGGSSGSGSTGAPSTSSTLATPPPFLRTGQRSNSQLNLHHHLGPLSTSLPAPRLVGYMKQRGGKSIAVRHTSVFGVRRKENTALSTNSGSSSGGSILSARKHSYASVVDAAGLSQPGTTGYSATVPSSSGGNLLRHRSKSDSGSHQALTAAAAAAAAAGNNSTKRGWEVWEADLYQCIFKDPGVWGLELEVRTIDLQPTVPAQPSHGSNNSLANNNINAGIQTGGLAIPSSPASGRAGSGLGMDMPMVTTNGSSAAVMVGYDPSGATPPTPKAKLRRRPGSAATNNNSGSHHNNIPTQGYVYSMADSPSAQHHHHLHPLTATGHPEVSPSPLDPWMVEPAMMLMEEPEPDLLPFVETRHIFAVDYIPWMAATKAPTALDDHQPLHLTSPLRPPLGRWPSEQNIQTTTATAATAQAPPNEMGGIIVGFGNWIKVVRLEDEEEDEEVEDEEDPDDYNERSF
ncbi:hypothetical protein BGW42_008154 [Actinomortierella wolfii]|nr:hypothetical protein BGW42_008154 [Actinomortierella wolfii]